MDNFTVQWGIQHLNPDDTYGKVDKGAGWLLAYGKSWTEAEAQACVDEYRLYGRNVRLVSRKVYDWS